MINHDLPWFTYGYPWLIYGYPWLIYGYPLVIYGLAIQHGLLAWFSMATFVNTKGEPLRNGFQLEKIGMQQSKQCDL